MCRRSSTTWRGRGLSGSRIRTVRNAIAVVYTFARTRYDVETMPAVGLALPGLNKRARGWSAPGVMPTPAQLHALLDSLPRADRLPFALAAMTSARRQEILNLDWPHVDFRARPGGARRRRGLR
jgi:integrase